MRTTKKQPAVARTCLWFMLGAAVLFGQWAYIVCIEEFYPSISMPGGAGKVRDGAPFSGNKWLLFAITSDGARLEVDQHQLLAELPGQYRAPVMANGFGLLPGSRATDSERQEARAWLRQRLAHQIDRHDLIGLDIVPAEYTPSGAEPFVQRPEHGSRIAL